MTATGTSFDPPRLLVRHRLTARFRDCDPLGHVNHAVFLTYCEQARFLLWRAQLDSKPSFIMARAEVDYRAQVRYGDELDVALSVAAIGRTSFTYVYEMVNTGTGQLAAAARTVLVAFDYAAGKPRPIDDDLRVKLATPIDPPGRDPGPDPFN